MIIFLAIMFIFVLAMVAYLTYDARQLEERYGGNDDEGYEENPQGKK